MSQRRHRRTAIAALAACRNRLPPHHARDDAGGARIVGNRRVTAPSGPAPVVDADDDEIETTAADDASPKTSTNDGRTS